MEYTGKDEIVPKEAFEHHGVKGMRWGVRKEATYEKQLSVDREKAFRQLYEKRTQMDTKELRDVVDRMRLENEMARLANDAGRLTDNRTAAKKMLDDLKDESLKQVKKAATEQAVKLAREQLVKSVNATQVKKSKKSKK